MADTIVIETSSNGVAIVDDDVEDIILVEGEAATGPPGPTGPQGPQGEPGAATTPVIVLTQTEYDALTPPDPSSLYVIISP